MRIDGGTQARTAIDEGTVAEYAEAVRNGAVLPPLSLFFDGVHFWLADGFHRYHAYLQAGGVERISAEIRTGSRRDAVLYAVGANAAHGLRRSNADKRRAVQMVLDEPEWAQWSDREIARVCGVSQPFVSEQRHAILKRLSDSQFGAAPATRTVTRNGTTYQQNVARIGKGGPVERSATGPESATEPERAMKTGAAPPQNTPKDTPTLRTAERADTPTDTPTDTPADTPAGELAQLRELAEPFEETLAEAEAMRKIIEADDQLAEAVQMLKQAQELNRVLETRLLGLTNEKNEVLRRYKGAARELDKIRSAHAA